MNKLNVDETELMNICREHGTGKEAAKIAADKFGISEISARNQIFNRRIKIKLEQEKVGARPAAARTEEEAKLPEVVPSETQAASEEGTVDMQPEIISNAEAADIMEPEQYPDLKEVATDLSKQFDEVAKSIADNINEPKHYTSGGIETIDFIQAKLTPEEFEGFCKGAILQYIVRCGLKGGLEDLKKAQWYLNRIIRTKEAG